MKNTNMKICHFVTSVGIGRGEVYVDLANEMSLKSGVEISLLVPKDAKFLERVASGVNVILYQTSDNKFNPFFYFELYKIFRSNKFDIVHTHFSKASAVFHRLHHFISSTHVATKHNPRTGRVFNNLKNVTAASEAIRNSISVKNVQMIYNGITPSQITPSNGNDIFSMVAIGRLDKIKAFDILINECAKLDFDFRLDIIGDGEEKEALTKLISSLKLEDKINLVGFQTDIPQRMQNADIVVMSSHSEGFPITMLEAIFYAKLFISTEVGGCNEVLPKQFLIDDFQIASKIKEMHSSLNKYQNEFGDFCIANRDKFILSSICDKYIKYYREISYNN